jgi:hypothetical protein
MTTYKKVIEDAVNDFPNSFIKFRISDQIKKPGYLKIRAEIGRSNDANRRFDVICNERAGIDCPLLPGIQVNL